MNIKNLSPTPHDVGWPAANTKAVQKLTQNLKIMPYNFCGWPTVSAGLTIHVEITLLMYLLYHVN